MPSLAPDPAVLDHVGVEHHLDALRQLEATELRRRDASQKLDEADRASGITHKLVEQLRAEADRLRQVLGESEVALARSREDGAQMLRDRELAELERDQLRADLMQAGSELRDAKRESQHLRQHVATLSSDRANLSIRLERMTAEEARARAACSQLEQSKIEQWLLHDSTMALPASVPALAGT